MIRVNVFINSLSAERFLDITKRLPRLQISTNLNVVEVEKKRENMLEVPFIFTVSYVPNVARIDVKGKAHVVGDVKELEKIHEAYVQKKPPPPIIIQSIMNVVFVESILISKTINMPPPIPIPQISAAKDKTKKPSDGWYRA
ncbi:hypothetical protein DRO34_03405 [Candidatus Bathyarchaeota archaeon]|nr:MAG: hypothetical protein DRO34_03405 [Candidatus Bathyarchaeota archaeon]